MIKHKYLSGGLMALVGLGTIVASNNYTIGSLARMGPGLFPLLLGVIMLAIGLLIAVTPDSPDEVLADSRQEPFSQVVRAHLRPWSAIIGGMVGVYSGNNNLFDVGVVIALGVAGYLFAALGFPPAPLLLGFVLGPMVEENFRRALLLARGDFSVFFTRPLSGAFMAITIVMMLYVALRRLRRPRLAVPAVG